MPSIHLRLMLRRIIPGFAGLLGCPKAYAVCYVEPDGVREVDIRQRKAAAKSWADWCRQDGCTDVKIHPLYTDEEIELAGYRVVL